MNIYIFAVNVIEYKRIYDIADYIDSKDEYIFLSDIVPKRIEFATAVKQFNATHNIDIADNKQNNNNMDKMDTDVVNNDNKQNNNVDKMDTDNIEESK